VLAWQQLRDLRTAIPRTGVSPERTAVFDATLEQSERFLRLAVAADLMIKPVLLFQGLCQAGRAIMAAPGRRPAPRGLEGVWKLSGAGIAVVDLAGALASSGGSIAALAVVERKGGAFSVLNKVLDPTSDKIDPESDGPSGGRATVGELWGELLESEACPFPETFPVFGNRHRLLRPLMTWWAVLFALSSVASSEPGWWSTMAIDPDSAEAAPIAYLLDAATETLPALILEMIDEVTAPNQTGRVRAQMVEYFSKLTPGTSRSAREIEEGLGLSFDTVARVLNGMSQQGSGYPVRKVTARYGGRFATENTTFAGFAWVETAESRRTIGTSSSRPILVMPAVQQSAHTMLEDAYQSSPTAETTS
jgi:hypothetical protein